LLTLGVVLVPRIAARTPAYVEAVRANSPAAAADVRHDDLIVAVAGVTVGTVDDADASVVWSPSSNLILYGDTAPIARMLELGMTVALGPDWTLSGEDHLLDEMRFAYDYGRAESISALTPERLWEMATEGGAQAVGLQAQIGTLEPGMIADVTVFGRRGVNPYAAVLDSEAEDVRLVLIGGEGFYGDLGLEMVTSINAECDMLDACGTAKYLCTRNTPGGSDRMEQTVEDVEDELLALLVMYGREADLEPLVRCD